MIARYAPLCAGLLLAGACLAQPAGEAPERFEFSGVQRTRYETLDPTFRAGLSPSDQVLALRTSLNFGVNLEKVQLFAEIMDSRGELNDAGSYVNSIVNVLEPIQAYVAVRGHNVFRNGAESVLRVGRMTLDLGKRRLMSRPNYRNIVDSFLGADWAWRDKDGRNARVLYYVPMRPLPADRTEILANEFELDRAVRNAGLLGLFYQLPPFTDGSVLETYAFDYRVDAADPAAAVDLLTAGMRAYRPATRGRWNYEVETILQSGESGSTVAGVARSDLTHRAHFVHVEAGYVFDLPSAPNLVVQYDLASGDEDPTDATIERFNTLFGDRRFDTGPTGIYGAFARSNLDGLGVRLTFRPKPRWQSMLHYAEYDLAEARDSWVGTGWRDVTGNAGRSVGRQFEGSFTWAAIENRLTVETGFARIKLGRFAKDVQGAAFLGDPSYFYASVTTTF